MRKLLYLLLLCALPLTAQSRDDATAGEWQLSVSAGYGRIDNPVKGRDDIQMYLLPAVSYYGKRFYLENTHLGYALYERDNLYFDLVGQFNEDGYFFNFDGSRALGLKEIIVPDIGFVDPDAEPSPKIEKDLSYLLGMSATWKPYGFSLRASALLDVTAGHHGSEYHLSLSRDWQWQKLRIRVLGRAVRKSSATNNYYYNFSTSETAGAGRWFYHNGHWQLQWRLVAAYELSNQLDIIAQWQYNQLDSKLQVSPLLTSSQYYSRFIGLRYRF